MFKRFFTYLFFNGASLAISMLAFTVVTHLMTPAEFGKASLVLAVVSFLYPIASLGGDSLLPATRSREGDEAFHSILSAVYAFGCGFTALAVAIIFIGAGLGVVQSIMLWAPLICLARSLRTSQQSLMVYEGRAKDFGLSNAVQAALSLLLSYVLLKHNSNAESRVLGMFIAEAIIAIFLIRKCFPFSAVSFGAVRRSVIFSLPLAIMTVPMWLINEFGKFFLADKMDYAQVGILALAFQLGLIYLQFSASILNTFSRELLREISLAASWRFNLKISLCLIFSALVFALGMHFFGKQLVGPRFADAMSGVYIVVLGCVFQGMALVPGVYCNYHNKTHHRLVALLFGAAFNCLFLLIAPVGEWLVVNVLVGFCLSMFVFLFVSYFLMVRDFHVKKGHI